MAVTFYPNYIHNVGFDAAAEPSVVGQGYASSGGETTGAAYDLVDSKRDNIITVDTNGETGADFSIDFDLTANITGVDFSIIDKMNLAAALADSRLTYNGGGTELTSPIYHSGILGSVMNLLSVTSNWVLADENGGSETIQLVTFTAATDNNWEWNFRDFEDGNFGADVTIGEISIGKKLACAYMPEIGITKSSGFGTDILKSKGGQKYGFKNYGEARRWTLSWIYISAAEKLLFEAMWAVTEGKRYPFYIDLGEAATPQLYYVRFAMDELMFTEVVQNVWRLTVVIEEEV